MATKFKRLTVGSIIKPKEGEAGGDYIRIRGDTIKDLIALLQKADPKKGLFLNLSSKAQQLATLENAISEGKISGEFAEKARARIEKIPDFVRFEIVANIPINN